MNYATQHSIGNHHNSRTAKTTTVTLPIMRVRQLDAKAKGRQRSIKRQTEISSYSDVTNGFLKCTFLPKRKETKTTQVCKESKKMEREFYQSLSKLTEHYTIVPIQTKQFNFPYNISLAMWDVQEKLKQNVLNWEEIRLIQDNKQTYLVSEERYNTGSTLFYIPIAPLYRMLQDRKYKRNAHLLLSISAYLYHSADIPYYRQQASYLYWMYEMMNDWIEQDDDSEETESYLSEIKQAEYIGDCMEKRIFNRINLDVFEKRINHFKVKNKFDLDCFSLAKEAFHLYQTYPNETVFRNAKRYDSVYNDETETTVGMEKYISFYADHKGWLSDTLIDMVNNELQEFGELEEPCIRKKFDGSDIVNNNLCFENRLFNLILKLSTILNEF